MLSQCRRCSDSRPFLPACWGTSPSSRSFLGGLMGRPPLSRRATTLACLGSESGGGDSLRLAVMADVVGVVVSAFRFTPFFCNSGDGGEPGSRACGGRDGPGPARGRSWSADRPPGPERSEGMHSHRRPPGVPAPRRKPRLRGATAPAQGHTAGGGEAGLRPPGPPGPTVTGGAHHPETYHAAHLCPHHGLGACHTRVPL